MGKDTLTILLVLFLFYLSRQVPNGPILFNMGVILLLPTLLIYVIYTIKYGERNYAQTISDDTYKNKIRNYLFFYGIFAPFAGFIGFIGLINTKLYLATIILLLYPVIFLISYLTTNALVNRNDFYKAYLAVHLSAIPILFWLCVIPR